MIERMNISAVAKHAGVSKATVSRVINGTAHVIPTTADRVRASIKALDFYPDTSARTLGSGRSHLYGLIISDITNPYFPELVKAFEEIAESHGQDVLISNTDYDPARMERCVIRMLQRKVDGVAIMTSEMEERLIHSFSERRIPTIFMDTSTAVPGASVVSVDYAAGIHQAIAHLVTLGHTRIGFISGPAALSSARSRTEAFIAALHAHGLSLAPEHLIEANHRIEGGHRAMAHLLANVAPPTAILGSNDLTAIGAMGAIHEAGLSIPFDISIIGFDDIQLSAYTQPALTTIHVPRAELAATAFRSLFHRTDATTPDTPRPPTQAHLIQPTLLIRNSTARPRSTPAAPHRA
jgi:DNA-binding LacI/PurR family transcriptional regulator